MAGRLEDYDINKISATGPGLVQARTGVANHFTIYFSDYSALKAREHPDEDIREALNFLFEGPSAPGPLTCTSNIADGSVDVSYTPLLRGTYNLSVLFTNKNIPGSPFTIPVEGESIKAHTLALRCDVNFESSAGKGIIKVASLNKVHINVNDKNIGGGLTVAMAGPKDAKVNLKMVENPENPKYLVTFSPSIKGNYVMYVKISGENVPGSPFNLRAVN